MEIPKSYPAPPFRPWFDGKINPGKFEPTGDLDLNNCYSQSTITMDINTGGAMRINKLITVLLIVGTSPSLSAAPPDSDVTYSDIDCGKGLECTRVLGWSTGNLELDCAVIRPIESASKSTTDLHPVIAWANGWNQGIA